MTILEKTDSITSDEASNKDIDISKTKYNMETMSENTLPIDDGNNNINNDKETEENNNIDGSISDKTNDEKIEYKLQSYSANIQNVNKGTKKLIHARKLNIIIHIGS